jgi:hypothetical protein
VTRLRLLQRAFVWLAVAFVLLTLLASGGCGVLPPSAGLSSSTRSSSSPERVAAC